MRGDNGGNKALPQTSNVGSDKRRSGDGTVTMIVAAAEDGGSKGRWQHG